MARKSNNREDEIDQVRKADQNLASRAKQEALEKRKTLQIFSTRALQAMKAKDERAYAEQLRLANVLEGSPEWKLAWEYYRAHCG
jgi:hypothetical protein